MSELAHSALTLSLLKDKLFGVGLNVALGEHLVVESLLEILVANHKLYQ